LDVFCTVNAYMSPQKVCGSIAIEIPILWPSAVMVGPRPRVLLTPPLVVGTVKRNFIKCRCYLSVMDANIVIQQVLYTTHTYM